MSLRIGATVDVVRGSYEGEHGTVTGLTPQMVYVDLSNGNSVRINQTSVRPGASPPVRVRAPPPNRTSFSTTQGSQEGIFSLINYFPVERTFGAEYEIGFPRSLPATADALEEKTGQAVQAPGYTHAATAYWKLVSDSTVDVPDRVPGELVSPKLSGADGLRKVESMLNAVSMLPGGGPAVNSTSGHHIHLDASNLSLEDVKKVAAAFYIYEEAFDVLMPTSRQADVNDMVWSHRGHIPGNNEDAVNMIKRARSFDELVEVFNPDHQGGAKRYYKLNLTNLSPTHDERRGQIKTMEFRQHSATWEAEKSCAWIMLLQLFVEYFKSQRQFPTSPTEPLTPAAMLTLLFSTINVPPILAEWWWDRATKLDQRPGARRRLVRVDTMERETGYRGMVQAVQGMLSYMTSPIRNAAARASSWRTPRDREPPPTPSTVQQPRRGRQLATPRLTVSAYSSLDELRAFIDDHRLGVKKNVGGPHSRTKQEMYNEIVVAFRNTYS